MELPAYNYLAADMPCCGYLALPSEGKVPRPAVLVFPDWSGCNDFARKKADMLANMGYVALAVDMYGNGQEGSTVEEKMALMQPLMADRALLLTRAKAAFEVLRSRDDVRQDSIAAIGFCFGGLCALDLARSGLELAAAVSFHGLLQAPDKDSAKVIVAKILVLHGYDDPMVEPVEVQAFCDEMTRANVDWQVHMYGRTKHAFTNPLAHDAQMGTVYDAVAEQRALQAMENFLRSLF